MEIYFTGRNHKVVDRLEAEEGKRQSRLITKQICIECLVHAKAVVLSDSHEFNSCNSHHHLVSSVLLAPTSILQIRKFGHREVKQIAQSYTLSRWHC